MLAMSGRKLSGAQSRKRNKNAEQAAKKSSEFFKTFFKKAKSDECESEDDDQLVVPATNKTVEQPQGDTSLHEELHKNQLVDIDIDDDAAKQIEHESQSPGNNDSFVMHHWSDDHNSVATDADDWAIKAMDSI